MTSILSFRCPSFLLSPPPLSSSPSSLSLSFPPWRSESTKKKAGGATTPKAPAAAAAVVSPVAFPSLAEVVPASSAVAASAPSKKAAAPVLKIGTKPDDAFMQWCQAELSDVSDQIDVATFVQFLKDVESPDDLSEFVHQYLGNTARASEFKKQFIKKRNEMRQGRVVSTQPSQPAAAASAAAAAAGSSSSGSSASKGKKKKAKQNANHLVGFSVSSVHEPNRGEIDYGQ